MAAKRSKAAGGIHALGPESIKAMHEHMFALDRLPVKLAKRRFVDVFHETFNAHLFALDRLPVRQSTNRLRETFADSKLTLPVFLKSMELMEQSSGTIGRARRIYSKAVSSYGIKAPIRCHMARVLAASPKAGHRRIAERLIRDDGVRTKSEAERNQHQHVRAAAIEALAENPTRDYWRLVNYIYYNEKPGSRVRLAAENVLRAKGKM